MARDVVWTEAALQDLDLIIEHIAKDSPFYAGAFAREVRELARSLTTLAQRGRIVPEFGDMNLREVFVRRYRLIYQVSDEMVYIIGFIHGARELLTHWETEDRKPIT